MELEVLRAEEEWQRAGAYSVRIQGMNRQHHISLREEFDDHDGDGTKYIVLLDEGYPVATCRFYETSSSAVTLGRVVVLPVYRGQGLGRKVVDEAEKWMSMASRQGVPWARTELKKIVAKNSEFKTARDEASKSFIRFFDLAVRRSSDPKGIADLVRSLRYFADAGSIPALMRVIKAYHEGIGVAKDDSAADALVRRAVKGGLGSMEDPEDRMYLAKMCCISGDAGVRDAVPDLIGGIDKGDRRKDLLEMAL